MFQSLKRVNWKLFTTLLVAGLLGVLAVMPYTFDLFGRFIAEAGAPDIPMPLVVALALLQNGVLLGTAIVIGMILSERVGFRMPLIRAWVTGETTPKRQPIVRPAMLVGAAIGAVLVGVEALFFLRHLPEALHRSFEIPLWKRLLAGIFYGGITEELLMRFFLLSLVAWLLGRRWKTPDGIPTPAAFWAAILVVAVLFGLGHLPGTAAITPLTQVLVVRALVLNGVAGVAFGYLYWRHGLEAAMLGHMSAHLVMQIPGAALLANML